MVQWKMASKCADAEERTVVVVGMKQRLLQIQTVIVILVIDDPHRQHLQY